MGQKKQGRNYITAIVLIVLGVVIDQYAKYLAVLYLKRKPSHVILKNIFELTYVENRGAAFGMLVNQRLFFIITGLLIFAVVIYMYIKIPKTKKYLPLRICGVLIFAGALGNLIDRVRLGYVVDFFYFVPIDFPVFNVADIFITVSFAALIILILFVYKEEDFTFLGGDRKRKKNGN